MIRYTLLFAFVAFICFYSLKDWYRALCYAMPLVAVLERPDMPRSMLGISGLNPYNVILLFVLIGWLLQKGRDGSGWTVPRGFNGLIVAYFVLVTVSFARMLADPSGLHAHVAYFNAAGYDLPYPTRASLFKDDFFNAWKWVIPGLLLLHGTTDRDRADLAMRCVLLTGLLLSVQVVLRMAPALVGLDDLNQRSLRVLDRDIGYHKVQLATYTAATAWGFVVYGATVSSKTFRMLAYLGAVTASVALLATGGRGGAVAWGVCLLMFGVLKWRRLLWLAPVFAGVALFVMPAAEDRLMAGVAGVDLSKAERAFVTEGEVDPDLYALSSGRLVVWPRVLQFVRDAPLVGYGMRAYERQGVFESLHEDGTLPFSAGFHHHPHSAYLMFLLDMGCAGLVVLLWFFGKLTWWAFRWFREHSDPHAVAVSGFCLAFMVVALVTGVFACTFYPDQDNVLQWQALGIFLGIAGRTAA